MPGGSTRFAFTLFNYNDETIKWFEETEIFKYVCFGREVCPKTLKPHLQGYFEFPNGHRKSKQACLNYLARSGLNLVIHLKEAYATAKQNIDYCSKDQVFWEKGQRPLGQGSRTDLHAATDIITNGGNLQDIAQVHPTMIVKYHRGFQALHNILAPRRQWKTEIYWLWGPSGSGKSRWAWENHPDAYSKDPSTKWWCGLMDQDTAIIDDFRPSREMPFNFILRLFDRYPMQLETKGGSVPCLLRKIIVTSPFSPDQMLSNLEWTGIEEGTQLKRRLDHVIQFPQIASLYSTSS